MPYSIEIRKRKDGKKWCLIRENDTVKSCHNTKKLAEKSRNLIMGIEHGWKPTNKK